MTTTPAALLELAGRLAEPAPLTDAARRLLAPWLEQIRPAVYDFAVSEMSEEYIVFQLGRTARATGWSTAPTGSPGWCASSRSRSVRTEVREATRLGLSYTPNDLVVLDWAAGVVADVDCADTLAGHRVRQRPAPGISPHRRSPRRPARGRLPPHPPRADADAGSRSAGGCTATPCARSASSKSKPTSLFERVDNALKLIGDHYLARVFEVAGARFHLRGWQQSIRRKLETVGDVYDLLVQQAGGQRMEALEITVVVLIALEIVLAILRH